MTYQLKCPSCKNQVTVSTHDSVSYMKDEIKVRSFDCPMCGEEIEGIPIYQEVKR